MQKTIRENVKNEKSHRDRFISESIGIKGLGISRHFYLASVKYVHLLLLNFKCIQNDSIFRVQ